MALPVPHPLQDEYVSCYTDSAGGTPIPAYLVAPYRCKVMKVGGVLHAAITSADCVVTTAIAGTAITGGAFTIANAASAAGTTASAVPTALNIANEGDLISFTPASASGSNVGCDMYAVVRRI